MVKLPIVGKIKLGLDLSLNSRLILNMFIVLVVITILYITVSFINKKQELEKFANLYLIGDNRQENRIVINRDEDYNDEKYLSNSVILNEAVISGNTKLYVGGEMNEDVRLTYDKLKFIDEAEYPYIETNNENQPKKIVFHNIDKDNVNLTADHLRVLKGHKLVPLQHKEMGNSKALFKIEANPMLFEQKGLVCGYSISNMPSNFTSVVDITKSL